MKRSSYGERDYAFGQKILTLRMSVGLTQAGLADQLGVSRRAVAEWEAGSSYPKAEHLKQLIALGVRQQAFAVGREAEEIRTLWKAARQKILLDEQWLHDLLSKQRRRLTLVTPLANEQSNLPPAQSPRVDWSDAPVVPAFYGRERELATISKWVIEERCLVVSVVGRGGIGKSALAVSAMYRLAAHFEAVIWRSLRDAPSYEALLDEFLQLLAPQPLADLPASLERRHSLLQEHLRRQRTLLVLDNLETLLEEGEITGRMRPGYEGYARLLRWMAATEHQSTLLLTSREKPRELVPLEGSRTPVRSLRLEGLDVAASRQLLEERELIGTAQERERLIERYGGNPLALKIVAGTIVELFGGEIAPFLVGDEAVFGSVRELLAEQFDRLSAVEQTVLSWLAILREPVTLEELLAVLGTPLPRAQVLEAVEALRRRSLLERGKPRGSFTLHTVVLEYVTARLIAEAAGEIDQAHPARLIELGFELATTREYVRQAEERLIVAPLLAHLRQQAAVEKQLLALLDHLRERADYAQGYGPANVLALLRALRGHLRGLGLSQLSIRGAYVQRVEMQDTTLAEATLRDSAFTEALDDSWAVATSLDGTYWAAGGRRGEVRVWRQKEKLLHLAWQAHFGTVRALAFSPDGATLASASCDCAIKLWNLKSGALLWAGQHTSSIQCLAFAPDGKTLASASWDRTVKLWDVASLRLRQALTGHTDRVNAVRWSLDGRLLASCGFDQVIWLWDVEGSSYRAALHGHSADVYDIAFAPDSRSLLSGSEDGTLRLWDVERGQCVYVVQGYAVSLYDVAWSPNGAQLASAGSDLLVTIWDVDDQAPPRVLRGHSWIVYGVAWSPDGRLLASSGWDNALRLWDATTGDCVQTLRAIHFK